MITAKEAYQISSKVDVIEREIARIDMNVKHSISQGQFSYYHNFDTVLNESHVNEIKERVALLGFKFIADEPRDARYIDAYKGIKISWEIII